AHAIDALGQRVEVREQQLGLDDLDVARWIDRVLDVHDIRILEAADDVEDRIRLANVRQELVAETLAFRCAANEAGDIDDLYVGVNLLLALGEVRQLVETAIDERHDADVRLDGAERIIRAGRPRGGQ